MTRVLMVVGNDITTDTRVRKSAQALSDAGYEVVVVCHAGDGNSRDSYLGKVLVRRVAINFVGRDQLKARIERRKQWVRPFGRLGQRALIAIEKLWGTTRIGLFWPRVVPEAIDTEAAFLDVIVGLRPDVIHAHDVQVVQIAGRAAQYVGCPWVYDAHEWVCGLSQYGRRTRRVIGAWAQLEEEWINKAARVITVSPQLAQALQRLHHLERTPTVVLNAPPLLDNVQPVRTLRAVIGLTVTDKVMVYAGGVTAARGVQDVIEALPELPGLHFVLVAVPHGNTWFVRRLQTRAKALGVAQRFHVVDPVAPHLVTAFLKGADLGVIPLRHFPSHEMALTNKLFEYLHAGLPVVVSDCAAQQQFVETFEVGEVFRAGDPHALAVATQKALARAPLHLDQHFVWQWSWQPQAQRLIDVYAGLVGRPREQVRVQVQEPEEVAAGNCNQEKPVVFVIGPANSAGQAWEWTRAAAALPRVTPVTVAVINNKYDFPADISIAAEQFARDHEWARRFQAYGLDSWSHVLLEAGRPIFGTLNGRNFVGDVAVMRRAGLHPGLIFHGSELRNPARHAHIEPWSPFRNVHDALTARLQRQWEQLMPAIAEFDGPTFVSTPDLLEDLPSATWLPVTVDTDQWWTPPGIIARVPLVVHMPSNAALKGSHLIDDAMNRLQQRGVCRFQSVSGVRPSQARSIIQSADVVLDQFALGSYGVLAVQAMAAGKPVVGHVRTSVRDYVGQVVPIVEATPDVLETVLLDLLSSPVRMHELGQAGRAYVWQFHNGNFARTVLAPFLGRADQGAGVAVTLGTLTTTAP